MLVLAAAEAAVTLSGRDDILERRSVGLRAPGVAVAASCRRRRASWTRRHLVHRWRGGDSSGPGGDSGGRGGWLLVVGAHRRRRLVGTRWRTAIFVVVGTKLVNARLMCCCVGRLCRNGRRLLLSATFRHHHHLLPGTFYHKKWRGISPTSLILAPPVLW